MEQFKLRFSDQTTIKKLFAALLSTYPHGGCFVLTDTEKVIYKQPTSQFDLPDLQPGTSNKADGVAALVLKQKAVQELKLSEDMYGKRVYVLAGPLWADNFEDILGVWVLALPKVDPITAAFDDFAPTITNMFPEGAIFYATSTQEITKRQGSEKFDIAELQVGDSIDLFPIASQAIQSRQQVSQEIPEQVYGVPGLAICQPLYDKDSQEIVGAFGIGLPRKLPLKLKDMPGNLGQGLSEISTTMEEIAASSSEIAQNQTILHQEINNIMSLAEEITSVLNFIKQIADETKMLGLNAAIEAARAGEHGRGFGVVAEEIKKLSDQSKETVVQIRDLISAINNSINNTVTASESTLENTTQAAAATEEATASVEQMNSMAHDLNQLAAEL